MSFSQKLKALGEKIQRNFKLRSNILLAIILILGFGATVCRLGYLQIFMADELQQRAVDQQLTDTTISAKRGTIYDASGKILATSASVWRLVLAPVYFENDVERRFVAKGLSEIVDVDEEKIFEKAQQNSYYVEIKRQVESDTREKILEFQDEIDEEGINTNVIFLLDDYKRYYPYGDLASSVIGFTGSDDQGLSGIEYQYDKELTGTPGRLITATNAQGTAMPFQYSQNIDAIDGYNLVLTIDETIQSIVEKYLEQAIIEHAVYNRGVCIIMDVNTGAVKAMASVGGFDLNDPYTLPEEVRAEIRKLPEEKRLEAESAALSKMWRNKAVSDTYYPGSVFKMFTAAMGVEENLVSEESTFYCPGYYTVTGQTMHCHEHSGHGTQNFRESILNSCNPAFMQQGELIGEKLFWQYYQAFGFSERTGIDLPGEAYDIFFSEDGSMLPVNLATASFGQNFAVTPIQVATAVCAIANGGYMVQPHVVSQILDDEGNVHSTTSTEVKRQAISSQTAALIADILEENVSSGSGRNGYVAGYRVAGKTGTSEKKLDSNGDGIDDYIASFCGFAPADNAEVVCLVFFDTPTGAAYYGSQVAAPVFAQIMSEVLPYLQVATQYTEEELAELDAIAGTYVGMSVEEAQSAASSEGFTTSVKGEGDTVLAQVPGAGTPIPQGGNVVLYTDEDSAKTQIEIPDLTGYTVYDVNYLCSIYDINISITGATDSYLCTSTSQSIPAGTLVSPGTLVTVNFTTGGLSD
ncbi:MAG: PASTA domain-containing protein [Ruminococcus sp.]|nr:PASTA domain-containing protein [Ruminococcus sp.]